MEWVIEKESDLLKVVDFVCATILPKPSTKARVIGLYGNLGAGKTTFTKKLVATLGGSDSVVSPTFILERDYNLSNNLGIEILAHIDAYRFDEWAENLGEYMPAHTKIIFEHTGGDTRKITIETL